MKTLAKIFLIISVCFFVLIAFLSTSYIKNKSNETREYNDPICGGVTNASESKPGKKIFKALCATCHKLDKKLIGPPLAKIDSTLLLNWITNRKTNIYNKKDIKTGIEYHKNNFGELLSKEHIQTLYEYLNND